MNDRDRNERFHIRFLNDTILAHGENRTFELNLSDRWLVVWDTGPWWSVSITPKSGVSTGFMVDMLKSKAEAIHVGKHSDLGER